MMLSLLARSFPELYTIFSATPRISRLIMFVYWQIATAVFLSLCNAAPLMVMVKPGIHFGVRVTIGPSAFPVHPPSDVPIPSELSRHASIPHDCFDGMLESDRKLELNWRLLELNETIAPHQAASVSDSEQPAQNSQQQIDRTNAYAAKIKAQSLITNIDKHTVANPVPRPIVEVTNTYTEDNFTAESPAEEVEEQVGTNAAPSLSEPLGIKSVGYSKVWGYAKLHGLAVWVSQSIGAWYCVESYFLIRDIWN